MAERRPRRRSLRRRLLGSMFLGFAALVLIISTLLWGYARAAANRSYDLLLAGAALSILERVSVVADGPTVDLPHSALEILALAPDDRAFYAVRAARSGLLTGMPDLPPPPPDEAATAPRFYDAPHGGELVRFVVQDRQLNGPGGRERVQVQVGQTRLARDAQARSLFVSAVAGLGAVSLIGLAFVWLAIRRALGPLALIERDLRARAPSDLSELALEPPREIESLIGSINGFITRLNASRDQSERFIADVAHQMRTSLSALQGQLALAADAPDGGERRRRLARAEAQGARTVRLTNQLLAHAMVTHRAGNPELQRHELATLVRELLAEMLRETSLRELTVTFDADAVPTGEGWIRCDPVSVREALRNLVENAVRHGPPDNRIDVAVRVDGERVVASVADAGPGIAPGRRAEALERFRTLETGSGGSGLGLSIVAAVSDAHGATFALASSTRGGLCASLAFPRAPFARPESVRSARGPAFGPASVPAHGAALVPALALLVALGAVSGEANADGPGAATGDGADRVTLDVWSTTDADAVASVIERFEAIHPGTTVRHREMQTVELHAAVLAGVGQGPDVVVSSAMDLQVDLVNRGLAHRMDEIDAARLPPWARWRDELFGFTFEPAALIYDRRRFATGALPRSHADFARFVRDDEERLRGRIGTYDIARSGLGYLYATQDAIQGQQSLRVAEALGRADARVFCCSSAISDAVVDGRLALGFNVIGSYALAAARRDARLGVAFFEDYNLVMARTAFVPRAARHRALAERYVAFLVSAEGQRAIAEDSALLPIDRTALAGTEAGAALERLDGSWLPIRLSTGLLTYLDTLKRARFLESWEEAIQRGDARPDAR